MTAKFKWAPPESDVLEKMHRCVIPHFEGGMGGTLRGKGDVELAYRIFPGDLELFQDFHAGAVKSQNSQLASKVLPSESPALVLLPGRGEPIRKYAEVVYDLRALGFSIYLFEHRGQGESGLVDHVPIQYIRNYEDYLEDLDLFIQTIVMPRPHSKLFLMGHSMGGAISAFYATQYMRKLDGLLLSAPMLDINTAPYPKNVAYALAQLMCRLGLGKQSAARDGNQVTSCQARDEFNVQLADQYSKIQWRKVSYQWILASLQAVAAIHQECQNLKLPILLLQAEKDRHVPAKGQNEFCQRVSQCKKVVIPHSLHEPLMEIDSIRDQALHEVRKFLLALV